MKPLSLDDPQTLIACSLSDLQSVVQAIDPWSDLAARQLDQVLRGRALDLLAGRAEMEELEALHRCMETLIPHTVRPQLQAMSPDWIARWRAWADLLDGRIGQLQARDPSRAHLLPHALDLLEAVRLRPGLTRLDLATQLDLPQGEVHRLVRILMDHGRVDVREGGVFSPAREPPGEDVGDDLFALGALRALARQRTNGTEEETDVEEP